MKQAISKLRQSLNTVRIQYASNIFAYKGIKNPHEIITPGLTNNLALLGNVGNFETSAAERNTRKFLEWCSAHWDNVFWIPGPSELGSVKPKFWWHLQDEMYETARAAGKAVQVLSYRECMRLKGMRIIGVPGWSMTLTSASQAYPTIWLPDTNQKDRLMTSLTQEVLKEFYTEQMEILKSELDADRATPTIILSHGLPSLQLIPRANEEGLPYAFQASRGMDVYPINHVGADRLKNVKGVLCGAVGSCTSGTWGGQRFMGSNAFKMYPGAAPNPNYMPDRFYEYCPPGGPSGTQKPALALPLPSLVPS